MFCLIVVRSCKRALNAVQQCFLGVYMGDSVKPIFRFMKIGQTILSFDSVNRYSVKQTIFYQLTEKACQKISKITENRQFVPVYKPRGFLGVFAQLKSIYGFTKT